jgi:hypothetical protein
VKRGLNFGCESRCIIWMPIKFVLGFDLIHHITHNDYLDYVPLFSANPAEERLLETMTRDKNLSV